MTKNRWWNIARSIGFLLLGFAMNFAFDVEFRSRYSDENAMKIWRAPPSVSVPGIHIPGVHLPFVIRLSTRMEKLVMGDNK